VINARAASIYALIAMLAAFILSPIASSGFLGDDQFNSTVNGLLAARHENLLSLVWSTTVGFLRDTARFLPLGYLEFYGTFHFFPNLAAYKLLQIFALAGDIALVTTLLRNLEFDAGFIGLTIVFVLGSIQFHGHYDGYLGFSVVEEYLLALTLGSWICFIRWFKSGRAALGIAAFALYVIAVLSYETCYPFALGHLILAVALGGKKAWYRALPFLSVGVAAFGALAVARRLFPQNEAAIYFFRLDPGVIVQTFFNQATAPFPLMFLLFHSGYDPGTAKFWSATPAWILLPVASLAFFLTYLALRRLDARERPLGFVALLGAALWLTPAFLISPIPRYQREISLGFGYIIMVIGGFGAALVLASVVAKLMHAFPTRFRTRLAAALGCLAAVVAVLSFETNQLTLATYEGERIAQLDLISALDDGVAASVPDGADLWVDTKAQLFVRLTRESVRRKILRRRTRRAQRQRLSGPRDSRAYSL
jgi:hypothetical protein